MLSSGLSGMLYAFFVLVHDTLLACSIVIGFIERGLPCSSIGHPLLAVAHHFCHSNDTGTTLLCVAQ